MQTRNELKHMLPRWLQEHQLPLHKPFHCLNPAHPDRHPSMGYDAKREKVHCFACGATYDIFELVGMELGEDRFIRQLQEVNRRYGDGRSDAGSRPAVSPVKAKTAAVGGKSHSYFIQRGLSAAVVKRFGLRVEGDEALLPFLENGKQTALCRRALLPGRQPRYRNSAGAMPLWNRAALQGGREPVFVTEGIFDALSLEECGYPAVALCGSGNQARLLRELDRLEKPLPLVLAGDRDEAGGRMNAALAQELESRGVSCSVLQLPDSVKDVNELLVQDREMLQSCCRRALQALSGPEEQIKETQEPEFYTKMRWYVQRRRQYPPLATGLGALDAVLGGGLRPGLCVLGGVSGTGKTTLLLQLADRWAGLGRRVLYFTAEMSPYELAAKSMVRLGRDKFPGICAADILDGQLPETVLDGLMALHCAETGGRTRYLGSGKPMTADAIQEAVAQEARNGEAAPVVIVDYLQLIAPERPAATDKQNTDRAVAALKQAAVRYDTPVLCASSFNREAYQQGKASMSAFKETGLVEYSADVLLTLSRAGEETLPQRAMEITVLKNRFGPAGEKACLLYEPAAETFSEGKRRLSDPAAPARNVLR